MKQFNPDCHPRKRICLLLTVAKTLVIPFCVEAADPKRDDVHVMDEVVVTTTSKTKMLDTPVSISVITSADLVLNWF